MKVSIILPVYNVEDYIQDCIKSIIAQRQKDFELVIVNDGTKDKSIEIAKKLLADSDVKYKIVDRENGGLAAARNTGIKNAEGEFLAFVDSDDVISPDYVKTLLNDALKHNTSLSIANFKFVDKETKFEFDSSEETGELVDKHTFLYKVLRREIFNYFGCFLIKREYILQNNLWFDETVFFGVDQAYMWRLMVGVDRYTYNHKQVYNYFDRPGSIMTGTKINKMLTGLPSLKKCAEDLRGNQYFDSSYIYTRWKIAALHTIAKGFDYDEFKKYYNYFKVTAKECFDYPHWKIKIFGIPVTVSNRVLYECLKKF